MQKITTPTAEMSYYKDRYLRVEFTSDAKVELEDIIKIHEACEILTDGEKYLRVIVMNDNVILSKEAKAYKAEREVYDKCIAEAMVIKSIGNKIAGNFYMNFNKLKVPTKLFSSEDKAINWLEDFLYLTVSNELETFEKQKVLLKYYLHPSA